MLSTLINAFRTLTAMQSAQWYSWGPPNMQCRLCVSCWMYWKKYGGLKMPSRAEAPEERTSPSPASNVSSVRRQRCKTQGMLWGEEGDSDKHQGVCSSSKHVYIHLTSAFWRNSASQPTIESTPFANVSFNLHEVRIYCFTVSFSQMHILHTYCFLCMYCLHSKTPIWCRYFLLVTGFTWW